MKNLKLGFLATLSLALLSCGGGGAPGTQDFGTVYITTSISKPKIDVDIVNYVLNTTTNQCELYIPMNTNEQQTVSFTVSPKPNLPQNVQPSSVVISDLRISFTPQFGTLDNCFNNIAQPTTVFSVSPNSIGSLNLYVINQGVKECLLNKYGILPSQCPSSVMFSFPSGSSTYIVYATLSFKATEANTGISKNMTINLGTYELGDFTTSTTNP